MSHEQELSSEEREACLLLLQRVADDPNLIAGDERFKALVAKIHRTGKKGERRAEEAMRRAADNAVREQTATVQRDRQNKPLASVALFPPPLESVSVGTLQKPAVCYVCKRTYTDVHFFYHLLCPECAALNYRKREQRADLSGRVAVITGGRMKIGFQCALRLLRDGARVLVTTRFPADAARRFAAEADFEATQSRLQLYALDLRHLPSVEEFVRHLHAAEPHLDILINNAAQTVKRPLAFYRPLLEMEEKTRPAALPVAAYRPQTPTLLEAWAEYPAPEGGAEAAALALYNPYFSPQERDADGQVVDKRPRNSWTLPLEEVSSVEMLETQLVNTIAPFLLCSQLKPLLLRSPHPRRFIVNVSAMEGQFGRETKTARHPHTNMAKAALNMLTRTSAAAYAESGIYMNSVDTGWITDEKPYRQRERHQQSGFFTPLDVVDGAARLYDPIARCINELDAQIWGNFLKDYKPFPW